VVQSDRATSREVAVEASLRGLQLRRRAEVEADLGRRRTFAAAYDGVAPAVSGSLSGRTVVLPGTVSTGP